MELHLKVHKAQWVGAGAALLAFLAFALAMPLARKFWAAPNQANAPVVTVIQRNRAFYPDALTIARGTIVHVVNQDRFTHHVYVKSPTMNFDSGEDPVGTSVNVEFDHRGKFDVQCAIHPIMHLWVTVQ